MTVYKLSRTVSSDDHSYMVLYCANIPKVYKALQALVAEQGEEILKTVSIEQIPVVY